LSLQCSFQVITHKIFWGGCLHHFACCTHNHLPPVSPYLCHFIFPPLGPSYHRLHESARHVLTSTHHFNGRFCDISAFFQQLAWRSDPSTDRHAKWLKGRGFGQECSFLRLASFDTRVQPCRSDICPGRSGLPGVHLHCQRLLTGQIRHVRCCG